MTREEILALDMADIEKRSLEIAEEVKTADSEGLDALNAELDAIEERKTIIKAEAAEQRAKMAAVIEGEGEVIEETKQEERKTMDNIEIRKSAEYLDAWVENLKGRATEEQRTLLTTNATANGTIAVPTYVEDRINTAWESNDLLNRIRKTYFNGNLNVGYEASSDGAKIHAEGGNAIAEEELVIGFVELIPKTIKKMVKYSSEVLSMRGEAFVDYIVDEIEQKIAEKAEEEVLNAMAGSTLTRIADFGSLSAESILTAEGMLGGEAKNPVVVTNRAGAAAAKVDALTAGYAYDPFDGMDIVYATMPSDVSGFVADLSGVQINFPDGDDVKFIFDEYTEAPADIVRVIGRVMMAADVVSMGKVVKIQQS